MRKIGLVIVFAMLIVACGGDGPTSPTPTPVPTPTPQPPTPTPTPVPVPTPTPTPPSPPATSFGAGTHRIPADISAGRYFSDPDYGCYWKRLRGFSGSLGDIIANEFVGFNAMQWIVQIDPSDAGFETDTDCGRWYKESPRHGKQAQIRGGVWLVGRQVDPGTYQANSTGNCYWQRVKCFGGTLGCIKANDFVPDAGRVIVTIRPNDLGFQTDNDCGTWSRVEGYNAMSEQIQTPTEIERNWRMKKVKE